MATLLVACAGAPKPVEEPRARRPQSSAGEWSVGPSQRQASGAKPEQLSPAEQERRRALCDEVAISRASFAALTSSGELARTCPERKPLYEARLSALLEDELASAAPCTKSIDGGSFMWAFSAAFEQTRKTLKVRREKTCSDWLVSALRQSRYEPTPELAARSVYADIAEVECALGEELVAFASRGAAERDVVARLSARIGLQWLRDWFKPIYSKMAPVQVIGGVRSRCLQGARAELAKAIWLNGQNLPRPWKTDELEHVPAPIPTLAVEVPECGKSTTGPPTSIRIAVTCHEVALTQSGTTRGGMAPCAGVPAMLGSQCYQSGGTYTREVGRATDASAVIELWVEGKLLKTRKAAFDARSYRPLVKKLAEQMVIEAQRENSAASQSIIERNGARAAKVVAHEQLVEQARVARGDFDRARTREEKEEAAAIYILGGGRDCVVLNELAKLYGVANPDSWPWSEAR